jgi:uncharacterized protein DUF6847
MRLTEALMRCNAVKQHIEQLKQRVTKVAKVPQGDTPAERPQALPAALELNLQHLQALITPMHQAHLRATLPDRMALMQVIAPCDYPTLWRRTLKASVTRVRPGQEHDTYPANACLDGPCSATTYSGRPAIHSLREAARYHFRGGLRHVPAVAGLVHSQAPPLPHRGDAANRSRHT